MPEYLVLLDSNVLFSRKPDESISAGIGKMLKECCEIAVTQFVVPRTVVEEISYQQYQHAIGARNKVSTGSSMLQNVCGFGSATLPDDATLQEMVKDVVAQALEKENISIIETPIASIDWAAVAQDSCWRNCVFEEPSAENPKWEKGFRDRLVLETAIEAIKLHSRGREIVFLSGDKKLKNSFDDRVKREGLSAQSYERIGELLSSLRLLSQSKSASFTALVMDKIPKVFFEPGNHDTIFYVHSLKDRLLSSFSKMAQNPLGIAFYDQSSKLAFSTLVPGLAGLAKLGGSSLFGGASDQTTFRPYGGVHVRVGDTEFTGVAGENGRANWATTIELISQFQRWPTTAYQYLAQKNLARLLKVKVKWSCKISLQAHIADERLDEVESVPEGSVIEVDPKIQKRFALPSIPFSILGDDHQPDEQPVFVNEVVDVRSD